MSLELSLHVLTMLLLKPLNLRLQLVDLVSSVLTKALDLIFQTLDLSVQGSNLSLKGLLGGVCLALGRL